ncbi:MAG TPA: thiolase family protein [Acidimicrobiia bacterium]|nr:thiolase family protein [Acidimicrobiia bacterium]
MSRGREAAVVGVGMSAFRTRRDDVDLVGLYQEGAGLALADAGLGMADIDMVVLAQSPDALHGIGHPEQVAAGALGLHGRPLMRINTGGATGASAVQAGWWAVASGRAEAVLVLGAEKMGDATRGAQEVLNKIWDPAYEALLPLNTIVMTAFQAVRHMHRHGVTEEQFAVIASRTRGNGARNEHAHLRTPISPEEVLATPYLAWPTRLAMACPRSSGACAVVVASGDLARRLSAPKAWVRGFAARANTYFMGDKMGDAGLNDHGFYYDLRLTAETAYRMAGITRPAEELQVAEPYVPFATMEPGELEALGLCEPGEAAKLAEQGHWDIDGAVAVCPSGGVLCANPISISAMARVAEAAQQVRGRAGGHQVDGVRMALGGGAGGSVQFFSTAVFGTEPS